LAPNKTSPTVRVESWTQLQDELFKDSWNQSIGRFRSRYAFRGLSCKDYSLVTTLQRLHGHFSTLENHLLRNFRKYAHAKMMEQESIWYWLSLAQHYGLPTRLMDWTYSPFTAAHFATANIDHYDKDGIIWAVNYVKAHELLPHTLRDQLHMEGANVFTVEMLADALPNLKDFDLLTESDIMLFFEPPSLDERIINQFAFFSVMSSASSRMELWLQKHPEVWRQIIIPSHLKWEIRDKLDQANVTERVLFPGLDGLSRWLKRHYSPRLPYQPEGEHSTICEDDSKFTQPPLR
jgi:hypothetical protein